MKRTVVISLLLIVLLSRCDLIKQYHYITKAKAPKGTFHTEIPFELINGVIVIKVKLNDSDKEFEFVLDSGAPVSILYNEALESSKAKKVMTYDVRDSQGNAGKSDYVLVDVRLGDLLFRDVFAAHSANPGEFVYCIASGGLIGADLMQTANWQIDFVNKKIVITDLKRSSLPDLKEYHKIDCSKRVPLPIFPWLKVLPGLTADITVKGQVFKNAYIDLGSGGALTLPKNTVTARLFKDEPKVVLTGYSSFGLLGAQMDTTFLYTSSSIQVEQLLLNEHRIDVGKTNHSLVGMKIFREYTMFFDFKKNDLYLKPIAKENKTESQNEFGFYLFYDSKNKHCFVGSLFQGSSAEKAGLQLRDTIVEINSEKLPEFIDFCDFKKWQAKLHSQEQLTFKVLRDDKLLVLTKSDIPKK